jgi:murein DD-endopeptidase MepM/ murein hydrolase activator NlpD
VEIHHPDGTKTRYAHLSKIQPLAGDWVSVGQLVGLCGKTGNADDSKIMPHLHFEIRKNGHAVDPSAGQLDPSILVR